MSARIGYGGYAGGKELPEHYEWRSMLSRCGSPAYRDSGIKVCTRWYYDYLNFREDMGPRPSPEHTIGRIGAGKYSPSNCRWVLKNEKEI
jgi:hypothetical protein